MDSNSTSKNRAIFLGIFASIFLFSSFAAAACLNTGNSFIDGLFCQPSSVGPGAATGFVTASAPVSQTQLPSDYSLVEAEDESQVVREGHWSKAISNYLHGGAGLESSNYYQSGNKLALRFYGTGIGALVETGPNRGSFNVIVDGARYMSENTTSYVGKDPNIGSQFSLQVYYPFVGNFGSL